MIDMEELRVPDHDDQNSSFDFAMEDQSAQPVRKVLSPPSYDRFIPLRDDQDRQVSNFESKEFLIN